MEKREDAKIFMLCHKPTPYGLIDNELITPLECGADVEDNNACETKDNTGKNISKWNQFYTEDTGIYWIWKNVHCKYKGQMQYRRRLEGLENLDFEQTFAEYDAIIAQPMDLESLYYMPGLTLEKQYALAHQKRDLDAVEEIILESHADYYPDYLKYVRNGKNILYSNGFVLKEEDYDKYCEFLFGILVKWLDKKGIHTIESLHAYVYDSIMTGHISNATMDPYHRADLDYAIKYQSRIGGSLAERIFTLYAYHNFKNILFLEYDKPEGNKL